MAQDVDRRTVLAASLLAGAGAMTNAKAADAPIQKLTPPKGAIPVAFLLDEGATMIDFAGPWEAFQDAGVAGVPGFDLFTVAPTKKSIHSSAGMEIVPKFSLADAPQPTVVVIPAQSSGRQAGPQTSPKVEWLKKVAPGADVVMSVCTGAFLLARTGLLDGLSATTHHDFFDDFAKAFPKVTLMRGRRFVDNGKFVTAGGLTSGVDGALHVVARYYGVEAAKVSAAYMEHHGDGWLSGVQEL